MCLWYHRPGLFAPPWRAGTNTLASRLENSGKYQRIFNKVAQGYPGASGDVFTQLMARDSSP